MRFALKTAPQHTTWSDMLAVWQAADDLDFFESGWTFDHFYPIFSDSTGPCLEGWVATTALAQATRRLRIGVLVTGMPYRHPAVLAKMAATLDVISTTMHGRFVNLTDARCEPKPVQRPHPPICIGGGGERRTLRSVARYAQHWNFPGGDAATFAHKVEVLGAHCEDAGRNVADITKSTHLRLSEDGNLGSLVEQAEQYAAVGLDLGIVYLPPPHTPAILEPVVNALAHLRD